MTSILIFANLFHFGIGVYDILLFITIVLIAQSSLMTPFAKE